MFHNKFATAVKRGVVAVQTAYKKQVKASEARAKLKMRRAKTKYEKERIKAELEKEKLVLQRQMYEAKEAVQQERKAVTAARHRAGVFTFGEQVSRTGKSLAGSGAARSTARAGKKLGEDMFKSLSKVVSGKPSRRATTRRKVTKRR